MDFTIFNLLLVGIGLLTAVFAPAISRLNARSFPVPSYRVAYVAGLATGIILAILLVVLGLRGLILGCPPFPIEQMPERCRWWCNLR